MDDVFDTVLEYLDHLRGVIKKKTATDKGWTSTATVTIRFPVLLLLTFCCLCVCASEYVQGLKLLEALDYYHRDSAQDSSVVQVVIGPGQL